MYLLGHTDPKLTMGVYQHVLDLGAEGEETLTRVLGGDVSEIGLMLSGRSSSPTQIASFRHSIDTHSVHAAPGTVPRSGSE
jgi:hypothetical protein